MLNVIDLSNIPSKNSPEKIWCDILPDGYVITTSEGKTIAVIKSDSSHAVAEDIAKMISLARDAGFEQGRKHVRDALGI